MNILGAGHEGDRDEIRLYLFETVDVGHVLRREGRGREAAPETVDALARAKPAADQHGTIHRVALDIVYPESDTAVIQQQGVAAVDAGAKLVVIEAHAVAIALAIAEA